VHIKKNIPIQAGMAGGSADGAAALEALYRLYNVDDTMENKLNLALSLGADVPFVLQGGLAQVQGIGEKLQFHSCQHQYKLLILCPHKGASTAQIFKSLDISKITRRPDNIALLEGLLTGNIDCISKQMINVLQPVTEGYVEQVRQAVEHQYANGAIGAVMTGSGSAVIGVYTDEESRNRAYDRLSGIYKVYCTETCSGGVVI
jgi:4-diphosphocytidyl-2-C-methyl-D-erythritol kinase